MPIKHIPTPALLSRLRKMEHKPAGGEPFTHAFFRTVQPNGSFAFAGHRYSSSEPVGSLVDVLKSLDITLEEACSLFLSSRKWMA